MAIRMMSPIPARVIQVLKDFLPAELDLVDGEESDGIVTPDIADADYYPWDQGYVPNYPACVIRPISSTPIGVLAKGFGNRVDVGHRLLVKFHVTIGQDSDPEVIQALLERYIRGALRVLCLEKEGLETTADPTRWAKSTIWETEATYGPESDQGDGSVVRTAILPIVVRRIEAR